MNPIEQEGRILRNLAILGNQVNLVNSKSSSTNAAERVVLRSLNIVHNKNFSNANSAKINIAAIDLHTADDSVFIQVKSMLNKHALDSSIDSFETAAKSNSKLKSAAEFHIVGLSAVSKGARDKWTLNKIGGVNLKAYALEDALNLSNLSDTQLDDLDTHLTKMISSLNYTVAPDSEVYKTLLHTLDRPAINSLSTHELSWNDLADAMKDIRRLITLGVDRRGLFTFRPLRTFQEKYQTVFHLIIKDSNSISSILAACKNDNRMPSNYEMISIDGYRSSIKKLAISLADGDGIDLPLGWPSLSTSPACPTCGKI